MVKEYVKRRTYMHQQRENMNVCRMQPRLPDQELGVTGHGQDVCGEHR